MIFAAAISKPARAFAGSLGRAHQLDFAVPVVTRRTRFTVLHRWALNYEFINLEEDKPRGADFIVLLLGTVAFLVGDDRPASAV